MIKLINGDFESISSSAIGRIDLIIADPPDNIGLKYEGFVDKKPVLDYEKAIYRWLRKMSELTDGPIFFTFNERWTHLVEKAISYLRIPLIQRLQWHFTFGQDQTSKGKYALCYRPIYWLNSDYVRPEQIKVPSARQTKYKDKRAAKGGKMPANIFEFSRICGTFHERRNWVPTQLPEALVRRLIKGHCCPEGCVLDPFLGSGTTAIICEELNLDCVGIELSEQIIQKTAKHLGVDYQ
jgi:site-specific DNA-methyltransferase (adenine-specific)